MIVITTPLQEQIQINELQGAEAVQILWEITNATKHNDPASVDRAIAKAFNFFATLKTVDKTD